MEDDTMEPVGKWARLTGEARQNLASRVVEMYEDEELPIRAIVRETGRSYGAVHKILHDAGVKMRPRGHGTRQ